MRKRLVYGHLAPYAGVDLEGRAPHHQATDLGGIALAPEGFAARAVVDDDAMAGAPYEVLEDLRRQGVVLGKADVFVHRDARDVEVARAEPGDEVLHAGIARERRRHLQQPEALRPGE